MLNANYLMAGNATFTIANPKGERYTFKVKYSKKIKQFFAYALTGPSNTKDFTYVGMVSNDNVVLTNKSRYTPLSKLFNVLNYAFDIVNGKKELKSGYFLEHNGHCGRCGRKLTTPESIKAGIGPVCINKQEK